MKLPSITFHPALWLGLVLLTSGGVSARAQSAQSVATDPIFVLPTPLPIESAQFTGSLSALKISKPDDAKYTFLKTTLTLKNAGPTAAKNVTATLFVSSNPYLDETSSKIKEIVLPAGRIGRNKSATLRITHRVSTVLAPYFEGKYLVVSFHADNLSFGVDHAVALPVATQQIKLF